MQTNTRDPTRADVYDTISLPFARILTLLSDEATLEAAAETAGVPLSTIRDRLYRLKRQLGLNTLAEIRRWWLGNAAPWAAYAAALAGQRGPALATGGSDGVPAQIANNSPQSDATSAL